MYEHLFSYLDYLLWVGRIGGSLWERDVVQVVVVVLVEPS